MTTDTPAETASHTPGPWEAWTNRQGAMQIAIDGFVICARSDVDHRATESIANAHLIAAAPKLLAAAKKVCAESGPDMPPSMGSIAELDSAVRQATGTTDV